MKIRLSKNKINAKLLLIVLVGIITATAALTVFSSLMYQSAFRSRYEEKLLLPGQIFLNRYYRSEDFSAYIDKLKARENLAAESEKFLREREYVLDMNKNQADKVFPPQYDEAKKSMDAYIHELLPIRDARYNDIKKLMLNLHAGAGLIRFYIFADLGLPDMYLSLFDAVLDGAATHSPYEDYGVPLKKSSFKEAAEVYRTGETAVVLNNTGSSERNKSIYYSFMPIKDDYGGVIAVIGTEINMQTLDNQLLSFIFISCVIILLGALVLAFVIHFALRRIIVMPIQKLTAVSGEIAAGNINEEIPVWISERNDEIGILGRAYSSMSAVLRRIFNQNDALFSAAMSGKLDARSDPSQFGGVFAQLANRINDTLNVIGNYLDSISGALAIFNAEYDIAFTNKHWKQLFAETADKTILQALLEAASGEDTDALKESLSSRLKRGDFVSLAWLEIRGERRCFSFLCSSVLLDGNINGAIIAVTDTTELVTTKDNALSANKAKSEFLSRVSHELRTPLNVIYSMAKLGQKDEKIENSIERFNKIVTSTSHLSNIINDVLEMSRMEAGKTEIKREPMRVKAAAEECAELLLQRAKDNQIELIYSIDPSLPELLIGDEFRVKQVLINLLSNAVKFTTEGQVALDVSTAECGADFCTIRFTVSDTGIGMSDSFLQKIFTPFEQEDSFLSRRYAGSGLGLSISNNLVALMGGEMTVESRLGKGSKFVFTIPFEKAKASAAEIKTDAQEDIKGSLCGKRILLADDIEINREIVLELFAETGAEIEQAGDGEEAYQKFADSLAGYYDCVLMDIQMPKMDGYTATSAIRALDRTDNNAPIIAMTANALSEDIERARASGMDDHIAKPIDFDICFKKVKQWCNGAGD